MSSTVAGHDRVIEYLNAVMRVQKIAHAYLFYGPENVGKFTVARALAKTFLCLKNGPLFSVEAVCNECAPCRSVDQYIHPNVVLIDPEHTLTSKKEGRKDIPISDIRELKRSFSLGAAGTSWRIAIINQAERMSQEATNAFLKMLEEPGERTLFILVTHRHEALFPTIVSRTQQVRFSCVPDRVLAEFLKHRVHDDILRQEIVAESAGRPGIAIRLLEDAEYREREQKFRKHCDSLFEHNDIPGMLRLAERVAFDPELRARTVLHIVERLRGSLLKRDGKNDAPALHVVSALKKCSRIAALMETTNVNPRLAMDVLFLTALQSA